METIEELIEESGDDEFVDKIAGVVRSSSCKLIEIWRELGITGDVLRDRQQALIRYQTSITKEMIKEEDKNLQRIREKVKLLEEERDILRIQLKVKEDDLVSLDLTNPTLLQQESWLKSTVEKLLKLKDQKMEEFNMLSKEEQELCGLMSLQQKYSAAMFGTHDIPSNEMLECLRHHIATLKEEKEMRLSHLVNLQKKIHKLIKNLEEHPLDMTSFQKEILYDPYEITLSKENIIQAQNWLIQLQEKLESNETQISALKKRLYSLWDLLEVEDADKELILSQYPLNSLKTIAALSNIVRELEEQRRANMGKCFDKAMSRLTEWWDKCMISDDERETFEDLIEGDYSEENLALVEAEIKKHQEFYEANELILGKIRKRLDLFNKMLYLDKKCEDKTRYHNRGGNLLKEEKERKTLFKNIPKLEAEVKNLVAQWEEQNDISFRIFSIPVSQYFLKQWDDYQAEKDNMRIERQQRNTPGTSYMVPSTPSKRSFTPSMKTLTPKRARITPYAPSITLSRIPRIPFAASTSRHNLTPGTPRVGIAEPMRRVSARIQNLQKQNESHGTMQVTPLNHKKTATPRRMDHLTLPVEKLDIEYSVTYNTFQREIQKKMTSTEMNSPSEFIAAASQHSAKIKPKVIGSKVVKRYSNEGQRRRSFNSSSRGAGRKLQNNAKPSRYQLRKQGDSFQI